MEADPGGLLSPAYRRLTVTMVLVVSFIAFEAIAVATMLPAVLRHLGGLRLYGWTFSAFMLAQLVGIVVAGPMVDRIGMTRPLLLAGSLFAAGLVVDGTAPSMLVLVFGRAVQGVGAGVLAVIVNVAVGRGFPPRLRPKAYAALSSAWVLPSVVGPALAGIVAEDVSWRVVFLAIVPAVAVALSIGLPSFRRADSAAAASLAGRSGSGGGALTALFLAAGTAVFLDALSTHHAVLAAALAVAGLAVAVPALVRVVPAAGRGSPPGSLGTMGVAALANLAFFGAEAFLPLALTSLHGRSVTEAGVVLTVAALTWAAGSWVQAHSQQRLGPRLLCAAGLAFIALGVAGVATLDWRATPWQVAFAAWAVAGFGMGLSYATTTLVVLSRAGAGRQGAPIAAMQVLITLGIAVGAGAGGAALDWSVSLGHGRGPGLRVFDVAAVAVALVGLVLTAKVPGRLPAATPAGSTAAGTAATGSPGAEENRL